MCAFKTEFTKRTHRKVLICLTSIILTLFDQMDDSTRHYFMQFGMWLSFAVQNSPSNLLAVVNDMLTSRTDGEAKKPNGNLHDIIFFALGIRSMISGTHDGSIFFIIRCDGEKRTVLNIGVAIGGCICAHNLPRPLWIDDIPSQPYVCRLTVFSRVLPKHLHVQRCVKRRQNGVSDK